MTHVKDRLALALDVGGLDDALPLARRLAPWFGIAKVGHELFAEAGPEVFDRLHELGFRVFADLKLYDIPTTIERATRAHVRHGVDFINFPAVGGVEMLRAAVAGATEGARDANRPPPVTLAVTVLTSEANTDAFTERLAVARDGGVDGAVCAAAEAGVARASGLLPFVPGVRLAGDDVNDQSRVATPESALAAGAEWLVIGRTVTAASDPEAAAARVTESAQSGLAVV
ncbi:MAG: orotidine-5'-phosphate decarboxylase [Acidimicrobiia bacterium]